MDRVTLSPCSAFSSGLNPIYLPENSTAIPQRILQGQFQPSKVNVTTERVTRVFWLLGACQVVRFALYCSLLNVCTNSVTSEKAMYVPSLKSTSSLKMLTVVCESWQQQQRSILVVETYIRTNLHQRVLSLQLALYSQALAQTDLFLEFLPSNESSESN